MRWANDGPITPRRPEDDVESGAAGALAAGTRAGERAARSGREIWPRLMEEAQYRFNRLRDEIDSYPRRGNA